MAAPGVPNWQAKILRGVGAPVTPATLTFENDWSRAEGGGASNNPFNTTQQAPGASSYNSVGVRNYVSPQQGINATVQTLNNGRYGNIIAALRQGKDPRAMAQALANSPWGTGSLVLKMLGGAGGGASSGAPSAAAALPPRPQMQQPMAGGNIGAALKLLGFASPNRAAQAPLAPTVQQPGQQPHLGTAVTGIAKTALTQLGTPYQWGGKAALGSRTDCSGLLQASARANGINIGRTTYEQFKQGAPVPLNQLQPGDAVFFHPGPKGPEHVAIYIGGGQVVEDPHTGASVEISKLAGRGPIGARRYG